MFTNSMSPVYKLVFVPPNVKTPPGSSVCALLSLINLVNQTDISGELHWLLSDSVCHQGLALEEASDWNARPIMPATGLVTIDSVICCTSTARCTCQRWSQTDPES